MTATAARRAPASGGVLAGALRRLWPRQRRARRKVLWRVAGIVFGVVVVGLLVRYARGIDWSEVGAALGRYDAKHLGLALLLAAASYVCYGSYDLIGRAYTRHQVSPRATLLVAMVGYAFNLNLGSMIGGVAARFRLYTRIGLGKGDIARIIALSVGGNWLGHISCAGIVFTLGMVDIPVEWNIDDDVLQPLGVLLLGMVLTYMLLCAFSVRRSFTVRAHTVILPSLRMALLQLTLAITNWCAIAALIWTLLDHQVPYAGVLGVLLLASIAALITHIPAGLGAIEAVFLALLSPPLSHGTILAALLVFRATYYLLPLALAIVAYVLIEVRGKRIAK